MKAGSTLIITFATASSIALAAGGIGLYSLERAQSAAAHRFRVAAERESRLLRVGLAFPGLIAEGGNSSSARWSMEKALMAYGSALAADDTASAEGLRSALDRLASRSAAETEALAATEAESARAAFRHVLAMLALAAIAAITLGLSLARAAARRMAAEEEALHGLKALLEAEEDQGASGAATAGAGLPHRGLALLPGSDRAAPGRAWRGRRPCLRLLGAAGQGGEL